MPIRLRFLHFASIVLIIVGNLISQPAQASTNKAAAPALTLVWQTQFKGDAVLPSPGDIAVDKWGNVYVSTQGSNRIKKFDSKGTFVTQWGAGGKADGQFNLALGV